MIINSDIKFYDTSAILACEGKQDNKIYLSSVTLQELERIKTSVNKDEKVRAAARAVTCLLSADPERFEVVIHRQNYENHIINAGLVVNDDMRILSDAIDMNNHNDHMDAVIFVTNDLCQANIANLFFGDGMIEHVSNAQELEYSGYKEIIASNETLDKFYNNLSNNVFNLKTNEYLILRDENNDIQDIRCWTGEKHRYLKYNNFNSVEFGEIAPFNNDVYQKLAFDSLCNNEMTLLGGPPGSGKSYIALGYLYAMLHKHQIDRIVIFSNPVVARNASRMGYYPGTVIEKQLQSQIGSILTSKLGGQIELMRQIEKEKLILIPAGDARGYETPSRSGVYIAEAQNLDTVLLKMLLQRVGKDCPIIIDGDNKRQIDAQCYEGVNNGIARCSEVFAGEPYFGQVDLKNIYRSAIAIKAEEMIRM